MKNYYFLMLGTGIEICDRSNSGGDSNADGVEDSKAFDIILCQPEFDSNGDALVHSDDDLDLIITSGNIKTIVRTTEVRAVQLLGDMFKNRVDLLNMTELVAPDAV